MNMNAMREFHYKQMKRNGVNVHWACAPFELETQLDFNWNCNKHSYLNKETRWFRFIKKSSLYTEKACVTHKWFVSQTDTEFLMKNKIHGVFFFVCYIFSLNFSLPLLWDIIQMSRMRKLMFPLQLCKNVENAIVHQKYKVNRRRMNSRNNKIHTKNVIVLFQNNSSSWWKC